MKGFKTVLFNVLGLALTLGDYFNAFPWSTYIEDKHRLLVYVMSFGVINIILRSMTTTPIFRSETKDVKVS